MALYSDTELLSYQKNVNWDTTLTAEELLQLLKGETKGIKGLTQQNVFTKILNFYSWHKVRHMVPEEKLSDVLADDVILGLFLRDLREKYKYVKSLL